VEINADCRRGHRHLDLDKNSAHATLNGGKTAEIKLKRFQGMTDEPAVLKNVRYWGTPRNDGFVMMPNELEAYREGAKAYRSSKEPTGAGSHLI
jgi:hypothetical protein